MSPLPPFNFPHVAEKGNQSLEVYKIMMAINMATQIRKPFNVKETHIYHT